MARMTANDFFTGLFASLALALSEEPLLSIQGYHFDESVCRVYEKLNELASKYHLDIRFSIRLHQFHNDSMIARNAIYSAAQIGLISLDNPEYQKIRFVIKPNQAEKLLATIPGGKELFSLLAEEFLTNYKAVTV